MSKTLSTSPAHKKLCVYLESQLVERLKIAAVQRQVTVSSIVADAVTEHLKPRGTGGDRAFKIWDTKGGKRS